MAKRRSPKGNANAKSPSTPAAAGNPVVPLRRKCGAMQVHMWLLEDNPEFRVRQADLERTTAQRMRLGHRAFQRTTPYRIPVVVHVVYKKAAEKIGADQVKSQIDALNRDYRLANEDRANIPSVWSGLATDANIEFFLAQADPGGQSTSGITYTETSKDKFEDDDSVKKTSAGGVDPWPTDKYLNLWVCTLGGGLLGYAQFPGGPAASDGVVILNSAFGTTGTAAAPFNLGRTASHECGHFLNLRHIWGDTEDCSGSDFVADTPPAQLPNYNVPTFPHVTCHNGPSGDMFMNYMDYVDDQAMVMFTQGQVARMHAALEGPRSALAM
jgi:hypothetical protein